MSPAHDPTDSHLVTYSTQVKQLEERKHCANKPNGKDDVIDRLAISDTFKEVRSLRVYR
jgi:hypothetical protein